MHVIPVNVEAHGVLHAIGGGGETEVCVQGNSPPATRSTSNLSVCLLKTMQSR